MRWNCPHCGVALAVSDDKLGTGWSFSRCYSCAGFALVRPSEVNLIKIDEVPPGENVLLPEAREKPMLGQRAMETLAGFSGGGGGGGMMMSGGGGARPQVKPSARSRAAQGSHLGMQPATHTMSTSSPNYNPTLSQRAPTRPPTFYSGSHARGINVPQSGGAIAGGAPRLPEPLPEMPTQAVAESALTKFRNARFGALPAAIALSIAVMIASGIYLYIQGQALWTKARVNLIQQQRQPAQGAYGDGTQTQTSTHLDK